MAATGAASLPALPAREGAPAGALGAARRAGAARLGLGGPPLAIVLLVAFWAIDCALELALLRRPYHDTANGLVAARAYFSDALHAGAWPFWGVYGRYSIPLLPLQDSLSWSPVGLLLARLFRYDVWTFAVEDAIYKAAGLAGAYLWARAHLRSPWAAAGVAVAYAGSALVHTTYATIGTAWALLLAPWLLVVLDRLLAGRAAGGGWPWWRAGGALALVLALLVTTGYPGIWLTAPFFLGIYALALAWRSPRALLRLAGAAATGAALAAGMVALLLSETANAPLYAPGAPRNPISPWDGIFNPWSWLSLWLANPGYLPGVGYGTWQHQYVGLLPALALGVLLPARRRAAAGLRLVRPVALASLGVALALEVLSPHPASFPPPAVRLWTFVGLLLLAFPPPARRFVRWERVDTALALACLAAAAAATSNPLGDWLRAHLFPFSIIRWNTWYLWVVALLLPLLAWRTLEGALAQLRPLFHRRDRRLARLRRRWLARWGLPAVLLTTSADLLAFHLPPPEDGSPDRIGFIALLWLAEVALLAMAGLAAAALVIRARLSARARFWLASALAVALPAAAALGTRLAVPPSPESLHAFVPLPPHGAQALDVAQQAVVLLGLVVVGLRARSARAFCAGAALVTLLDLSLAGARYAADSEVVVVGQWTQTVSAQSPRLFAFRGASRITPDDPGMDLLLARAPTMIRPGGLLPQLAAFDDAMGTPSVFEQLVWFPSWWTAAGPGAVEVTAEALRGVAPPANGPAAVPTAGGTGRPGAAGIPAAASGPEGMRLPDCARSGASAGSAPSATVTRLLPDRIVVQARVDCDRLLVYTDTWAPGWRVAIDGRPAPALRVDGVLRGVLVPAGEHTVEWVYRPLHLLPLLLVMGASFIAAVLLAWAPFRRRAALTP